MIKKLIKGNFTSYINLILQEVYEFSDPDNPKCPTVLHFVLANITFKNYLEPGYSNSEIDFF